MPADPPGDPGPPLNGPPSHGPGDGEVDGEGDGPDEDPGSSHNPRQAWDLGTGWGSGEDPVVGWGPSSDDRSGRSDAGPSDAAPEEAGFGRGKRRRRLLRMPEWWTDQPQAPPLSDWAHEHGWSISDGDSAEDAHLADLIASAPMRLDGYHRARAVVRGRVGSWRMSAFEIVYERGRDAVRRYAVTAAPTLFPLPNLRLMPARFWAHGTGGMLGLPSGVEAFDSRWRLVAEQDSYTARSLLGEPVRSLLLASEDRDEIWSGAGHVAIARPDNHYPDLLGWHTQVLATLLAGLSFAG